MRPISEIGAIILQSGSWSQEQVELVRAKLKELVSGLNQLIALTVSTAVRVLSGELRGGPTNPRGMTTYTFAGATVAEEVAHGLEKVPTGYLVIRRYPLGTVADASLADWNQKTVWLQTDTAGLSVTLLFF